MPASHDNAGAVVLQGVGKTFRRRGSAAVEAAKDVSLSIDRGRVFGFLGPNGLDEPTLGLDVESERTVRRWVRRLAAEQGKTVLLTTHRLDMAEEVCDQVAIIRDGALLTDMSVVDLLDSHSAETYRITLDRPIAGLSTALGDLTTSESDGSTIISEIPTDQGCLDSVLRRLFELDLPISRIELIKPNLEDIFVDIVEDED